MTHEFKKIVQAYQSFHEQQITCVLATVVDLDGSSYRRPGVRMLLTKEGKMIGAVSGGCVEKEVYRQALSVFETGTPKVMVYDGRYRLGCEGILYVLLEPFQPNETFITAFWELVANRTAFTIESNYKKEHTKSLFFGSVLKFKEIILPFRSDFEVNNQDLSFAQALQPCFKLVIVGAEHDAVQLCSYAALTGWEVTIVVNPKEEKSIADFPGANHFIAAETTDLDIKIDAQTAIILMTHSFVKDLQYLIALKTEKPAYFGLLGPSRRREKLFDELLEKDSEISAEFLEQIHGPAGIDIGAETPQEIAVSIISEILAVVTKKQPMLLKEKVGRIHS